MNLTKIDEFLARRETLHRERELERLLRNWGYHRVKEATGGLGFSSRSIEGRLQSDGGVLSTSSTAPDILLNTEYVRICDILTELVKHNFALYEVIEVQYASICGVDFEARRMIVKNYKNKLARAREWLWGRLASELKAKVI